MAYGPHSAYINNENSEILYANPERLVQLLYERAIREIKAARESVQSKDIPGRVRHINKAFDILVELHNGLDREAGGEIAANYERLYEYCRRRLLDANAQQSQSILAEVQSLFEALAESWQLVVTKVGADRHSRLLSGDFEPGEHALAGNLSCVG